MPELTTENPTIVDIANVTLPDGSIDKKVVDMLARDGSMLKRLPMFPCNDVTTNVSTLEAAQPAGTWVGINEGSPIEKGGDIQVRDTTGRIESWSRVHQALIKLNGNTEEFRFKADRKHIRGIGKTISTQLMYGDLALNDKAFTGIAKRYSDLSAGNAENIIQADNMSVTEDVNTSIFLMVMGEDSVHGIYPAGTENPTDLKNAIITEDLGLCTVQDKNGNQYRAYQTRYESHIGLCLKDWRQVARLPNIQVSALTKNAATGVDIIDGMVQLLEIVDDLSAGDPVFYCNKTIRSFLRRQIANKSNVWLHMESVAGKRVLMFDEVPVERLDCITNTEALVA